MSTWSDVQFNIESAKNGLPILSVLQEKWRYIHSRYDPVGEANVLVQSWNIEECRTIAVFGLGLGYHLEACFRQYPDLNYIFVIEPYEQIIHIVQEARPEILNDNRVIIVPAFSETVLSEIISDFSLDNIYFHPASIDICPYEKTKQLLQESLMIKHVGLRAPELLMSNWTANVEHIHAKNVLNGQMNRYAEKPGIVIAAGPSLDKNLSHLYTLQSSDVVMLAVGAVLKKLLQIGIRPTTSVLSDGGPIVMGHIDNLDDTLWLPPLLLLSTAYKQVWDGYAGDISWVLQCGFEPALHLAQSNGFDVFDTGGSVATLCLSILYYWGCNPIVFVGQDLAYMNGQSHVGESNHDFMIGTGHDFRNVKTISVHGDLIPTTITWNSFRHWIEAFIETHPDRTYINASEGASIRGASFQPLDQILKKDFDSASS